MPDTGAPWNIPYVESTDLVSDWPADSLALANAIDAGLDAAGSAGIGSNVVQTVKTDTFSTTSLSFTGVTGLSVTITPTSASSKVLLLVNVNISNVAGSGNTYRPGFVRVTGGNADDMVGDTAGSRVRTWFVSPRADAGSEESTSVYGFGGVYLDSPATTSAVTYEVEGQSSASDVTLYVNRSVHDADISISGRTPSSITAIEVAA